MNAKVKQKLEDFIDSLETEYGDLEGIELLFEHPIIGGERQKFASIKEFNLIHLTKTPVNCD